MQVDINELKEKAVQAKLASKRLSFVPTSVKNEALLAIAKALLDKEDIILRNNEKDYKEAEASGMSAALLDRLMLDSKRIKGISEDVKMVAALPDPVGEIIEERTLPNGLALSKRRVPLGVIGAIYESRPNVTVDISVLCLKSGNAVILRGGKESARSNLALAGTVQEAAYRTGIPAGAVQFIESADRSFVDRLLKMKEHIDLVIPRGGAALIKFVRDNAAMAVVAGGIGVCHLYVDRTADIAKAAAITFNAKVQRPTVCNALDCVLVHKDIAAEFLPVMAKELAKAEVELHCDHRSLGILKSIEGLSIRPAVDDDWGREYLSLVMAVKVVDSLDEALQHIDQFGSGHSEAIASEEENSIQRFLNEVDAACVYANASTRFTDGAQFGMGAEIGISTQKFHARGPMALREITSYKWCIRGSGQVRS
ncbi:MAG: glutamate-5-semialdehyde dehydrogenase [Dehalococcoidia bacterium]|nr:glutamate-5-semialdehyde dehydrogenase [Dehalococcoidia bacterium]